MLSNQKRIGFMDPNMVESSYLKAELCCVFMQCAHNFKELRGGGAANTPLITLSTALCVHAVLIRTQYR